jgi:hypothetical protein
VSEGSILIAQHTDIAQRFKRQLIVMGGWTTKYPERAIPPHHDGLERCDRKVSLHRAFLGEVADTGAMVTTQLLTRAVEDLYVAAQWTHEAQDCSAQGRLSGSIRADDPDELTFVDLQRNVLQRGDARKAEARI